MKRTFLSTVCAVLSLASLSSCQKEDKSSLTLAKELTQELQTVVDFDSAELAAPRVAVINQRYQDAGVQVFALNGTALLSTAERSPEYVDALVALAVEMGRVRASKPVTEADGAIDRDALLKAVGNTATPGLTEDKQLEAGTEYYKNAVDTTHSSAGTFADYYGSSALGEALAYVADPIDVGMFSMGADPAPIPDKGTAPAKDDAPAADEEADDEAEASEEE